MAKKPATKKTKLETIFDGVAKELRAEFDKTQAITHAGAKGQTREAAVVSTFLERYTPGSVAVGHGDQSTPPFLEQGGYRIVPAECLYGVVEVKSFLDKKELKDAWEKIRAVKRIPKTAFHPQRDLPRTRTVYGRAWDYCPPAGIIFAFDGINIGTLHKHLMDLADGVPAEERVDSVWVLEKGSIFWVNPQNGKLDVAPEPGAGSVAFSGTSGSLLLALLFHLHQHFGTAWMPAFRVLDYMKHIQFGKAVSVSNPPRP